jgi:hypothetical protein
VGAARVRELALAAAVLAICLGVAAILGVLLDKR